MHKWFQATGPGEGEEGEEGDLQNWAVAGQTWGEGLRWRGGEGVTPGF